MNVLESLLVLLLCVPPSVLQSTDGHTTGTHSPESLEKYIPYGTTLSLHVDRRIANTSVAPWTYISNEVTDRIPKIIWIAECKEKTCLNNSSLMVAPVNMTMPVFYKRQKSNTTHYSVVVKKFSFTVACTCTWLKGRTH